MNVLSPSQRSKAIKGAAVSQVDKAQKAHEVMSVAMEQMVILEIQVVMALVAQLAPKVTKVHLAEMDRKVVTDQLDDQVDPDRLEKLVTKDHQAMLPIVPAGENLAHQVHVVMTDGKVLLDHMDHPVNQDVTVIKDQEERVVIKEMKVQWAQEVKKARQEYLLQANRELAETVVILVRTVWTVSTAETELTELTVKTALMVQSVSQVTKVTKDQKDQPELKVKKANVAITDKTDSKGYRDQLGQKVFPEWTDDQVYRELKVPREHQVVTVSTVQWVIKDQVVLQVMQEVPVFQVSVAVMETLGQMDQMETMVSMAFPELLDPKVTPVSVDLQGSKDQTEKLTFPLFMFKSKNGSVQWLSVLTATHQSSQPNLLHKWSPFPFLLCS